MFNQIDPKQLDFNPFGRIGHQWMLITAGNSEKANTMTASWGGAGVLWNKNVVTCYEQLVYCGRVSGRDEDKMTGAGLTVCHEKEAPYFAEAETVLICRKIYVGELKPEGIVYPADDAANYPEKDYHIVYIGEITEALTKS